MNVLVTVKAVAVLDDEFELDGDSVDERYVSRELNEWDEYAIETAVRLREAGVVDKVVAVTVGPEAVEGTVRQALARGPDRAVRIWDDRLSEMELADPRTTARLLAAVARDEEPELVLTGVQSADEGYGATGVALAARLGFEWAAVVNRLDVDPEAGVAAVHRELEGAVEELTEVELPAVLTIQTGINEPRDASPRDGRTTRDTELTVRSLDDLGLTADDIGSPLGQHGLSTPERGGAATLFEGEDAVADLATVLREQGVGR